MAAADVTPQPQPIFFATSADFRTWLDANGTKMPELLLAYYKKGSGRPSITYPESVDEALCYGWIDGVRRNVDAEVYTIRFTPRKAKSYWSAVNIKRAGELTTGGRMAAPGLQAFNQRDESKTERYSFERANVAFTPEQEALFRGDADAWAWFNRQPVSYQRPATHWVTSAKQEATRRRRLEILIVDSGAGRRIPPLQRPGIDKPLASQKNRR